ncbi:MAG: tetratricopeptide repeat protein [Verrucomicrobia bacterium]|jgi:tetratricopeptide (TPR) repeat protein|nr:tetratricopeptide repeat protein [Verrucomicrobiota bacterium]MBT7068892.1 tetratricopeptide repeat protein [Verrucomicrobiota bacterium]MBT7701951.1 tetratricopeptide repeat protein [Verrucomicrobiota bacterium]
MKNVTRKLLLAGFGLLLGLVLAEVALRVHTAAEARRVPRKRYVDASASTAGIPATAGEPSSTAGEIRMAVLGGSTSNGSPYSNAMGGPPGSGFNLLSVTRFLLEKRYGCPPVKIDNYAGPNWSAQTTIEHYCERPGPRPDVLVLYTGQNETTQYYSPNMVPPPAFLSPLVHLQSGNLLLRRLFTRQVVPADQRYTGKFFSDNVIPPYEREYSLARVRRHVEQMIRHARAEGIFMVIVIPQSNYLFPPTRSVYRGPAGRKAEALRLFKQAWQARYVENQPGRARALLEELRGFCSFADLFYELGKLHYAHSDFETALAYLRRARESDGFPICITPAYREVLRELVEKHAVPHVDMDEVIRENLGRPVPDYTSFMDDCHLYPDVYVELSREMIRQMRENGFDKLDLPPKALGLTSEELGKDLGIMQGVWLDSLLWEANYHVNQGDYTFRKLGSLKQARNYLLKIGELVPKPLPDGLSEDLATVDRVIRAENERMRKWVHHEGPMPLGASSADEPPQGFGKRAGVEASLGDALLAHGEWDLAIAHYRAALAMDPDHLPAHANLGGALYSLRQFDQAVEELEKVLAVDPQFGAARQNMGNALLALDRPDEAIVHFREAVRLAPGDGEVLSGYCVCATALARRLATAPDPAARDGNRAVELAEDASRISGHKAFETLDALAAAYAETGRFEDAVSTAARALELARYHGNSQADAIARRLAEYKAGRPWREGA